MQEIVGVAAGVPYVSLPVVVDLRLA